MTSSTPRSSSYSDRYCTPSPLYPVPSPARLERLLWSWERLRQLNTDGYRTSRAEPASTWLVRVQWAEGRRCGPSVGRGTTCSPFTTQATAMLYSDGDDGPFAPRLADGQPLPIAFSHAANSVLNPKLRSHAELMGKLGMTPADNEWPRPIIFFNLGYAVEPTQLRRGDAVHIDWMNGGGHAVFCWDVHLNDRGEVDAFQYVSSNGSIAGGGSGGGISVGGTSRGAGGFLTLSSAGVRVNQSPLFVDDERYVREGAWVTWDNTVAGKVLRDLRQRPGSPVKLVRRVRAARFFGIDPAQIPLFAMGEDRAGGGLPKSSPEPSPESGLTGDVAVGPDVKSVQRCLKLLFLVRWLKSDVGAIDGKAGRKTAAAIIEFQGQQGLRRDGRVGPLTWARLQALFRSACDAPEAKRYLAPNRPTGLSFASSSWWEDSALYFRHGWAQAGASVELILAGDELPQESLSVDLCDAESGQRLDLPGLELTPVGVRASVSMSLPDAVPAKRIVARLRDCDLQTAIPLCIVPRR